MILVYFTSYLFKQLYLLYLYFYLSTGREYLLYLHMSGLLLADWSIHQSHQLGSGASYLTLAVLIAICYQRPQMCVDTS